MAYHFVRLVRVGRTLRGFRITMDRIGMYVVEQKDEVGGWYPIASYATRAAAVSHARMVRTVTRTRTKFKVRESKT